MAGVSGVVRTRVGYAGGTAKDPTYRRIGDHTEVVELEYDEEKVSLTKLLDLFWEIHDPTASHKAQYMSLILCNSEEEKAVCVDNMEKAGPKFRRPIVTKIRLLEAFYQAEDYHQKYLLRNQPVFMHALGLEGQKLVSSPEAAKLNALAGGYTTAEGVMQESKLSPKVQEVIQRSAGQSGFARCGI